MKALRTREVPGGGRTQSSATLVIEPRLIEHFGKNYLLVQAEGMFIGAAGTADAVDHLAACPALILHHDKEEPGQVGIALIYAMDVTTMRQMGAALIKRAREFEAGAARSAAAALRKASGK